MTRTAQGAARSGPESIAKVHTTGSQTPRILLVEDDADLVRLLEFRLSREGFGVGHAPDGEKALAALREPPLPDLIILDVLLPFMNGFEVLARIRADPAWADIPVVMLTSNTREEDVLRGLRSGANDYLTKPFRPPELIARIRGLLARKSP